MELRITYCNKGKLKGFAGITKFSKVVRTTKPFGMDDMDWEELKERVAVII